MAKRHGRGERRSELSRLDMRHDVARLAMARHYVRAAARAATRRGESEPAYPVTGSLWFLADVRRGMVLPSDVSAPADPAAYPADTYGGSDGGRPRYVTVYHVTREYGGPEEGGWWWDRWCAGPSVRVRGGAHAARVADVLRHRYGSDTPPRPLDSVLSTGTVVIVVESRRRRHERLYTEPYS